MSKMLARKRAKRRQHYAFRRDTNAHFAVFFMIISSRLMRMPWLRLSCRGIKRFPLMAWETKIEYDGQGTWHQPGAVGHRASND